MANEVGKPAPAFTLKDTHGKSVKLSDFKGKTVVLYFYPKDDTPGCTKEACGFRDFWNEIEATGATVIGVSPDNGKSHQQFIDKYELPFTLLCDPDKEVMSLYGAWGEKMNYGLVTFSENAYDGQEAVVARGTDQWGVPTGGEERNYGDFLSAVRAAALRAEGALARYGRASSATSSARREERPRAASGGR